MQPLNLVLLCGLLCDGEIWRDVADELKQSARVQIFSFPNFSSIGAMADHVLGAVSGRFAIAGHSMGGRVALEIARREPRRVSGLALLNTGIHPPSEREPTERAQLVDIAREHGMKALADVWLPPMLAAERDAPASIMERLQSMVQRSTPESFASQIHALLTRPAAKEVLVTLDVPIQLISASRDRWSPPAQHEAMRRLCTTADFSIVDNAGHMSPIEQPLAVAAALKPWITRIGDIEEAGPIEAVERLLLERDCALQIIKAARLTDDTAYEALSEMFTEDGLLARPSEPDNLIRGRSEILKSLKARAPRLTRHVISNVEIVIETRTQARARSTLLLFNGSYEMSGPSVQTMAIGSFHDSLVKTAGIWLFRERRGYITMQGSLPDRAA